MNLLDVNVLVALCDADHVHHATVRRWFKANAPAGWATCPLTENGLLRVMGHPAYPGGPGSPGVILPLLKQLRRLPGHQFWEDSVSLVDEETVPSLDNVTSKQLTDLYLLALSVSHQGKLVTLDSRIEPERIPGGTGALLVIR